ncbi:hypothetical protein HK101_010808 [Irineochytrium annulatum]|nr:hypothetical protein HK101_010808 [Irineochytrium annulatum]
MEAAFVSAYVRELARNQRKVDQVVATIAKGKPFVETGAGVVAFIDISGFSKLTAELTKYGRVGSEIVTRCVGSYMTAIVDVVLLYGGDVVKFLGDAVLVAFTPSAFPNANPEGAYGADPGSAAMRAAVWRALACTLHVGSRHGRMRFRVPTNGGDATGDDGGAGKGGEAGEIEFEMGLHSAVVVGELAHIVIGDGDRLDYAVHGACFGMMGMILDGTKTGQVGISSGAASYLGLAQRTLIGYEGDGLAGGFFTMSNLAEVVRSAIPDDSFNSSGAYHDDTDTTLACRLLQIGGFVSAIAMRRPTTPLDDLLCFDESQLAFLGRFVNRALLKRVRESIAVVATITRPPTVSSRERTMSTLGEFRSVVIIFVKILSPFEVTGAQKLLAALLESLRKFKGVLQQFSGDAVNMAARLLHIGEESGLIVLNEGAHHAVRHLFSTVPCGTFHVKGYADPVSVWGIDNSGSNEVGRGGQGDRGYASEKAVLLERLERWRVGGERSIIVIEAPSGMGKSSLATFYIKQLEACGIPHYVVQGAEIDQWTPFSGLQPLLVYIFNIFLQSQPTATLSPVRVHLRHRRSSHSRPSLNSRSLFNNSTASALTDANDDAAARTVGSLLAASGADPELAHALGKVMPRFQIGGSGERLRRLDGRGLAETVRSVVVKIVMAFVERAKTALIFDDAQWLDSNTLEILHMVAKSSASVSIVFLTRPVADSANKAIERIIAFPGTTHIRLGGLGLAETEAVIVGRMRSENGKIKAVFEETAGSPLLVTMSSDVLSFQLDAKLIVDGAGVVQPTSDLTDLHTLMVGLDAAILLQFDRVDPRMQRVLKAASVLGQYFSLANLLELGTLTDIAQTPTALHELIRSLDTYAFLRPVDVVVDSSHAPASPSIERLDDDEVGYEWAFRHTTIVNAIYGCFSFEERLAMNLRAAERLEELMEGGHGEKVEVLPLVVYHYGRTDRVGKLVGYKEELGLNLIKSHQMVDGVTMLSSLLSYVDTHESHITTSLPPVEAAAILHPTRRALWLGHLCAGYLDTRDVPAAKQSAIRALKLLRRFHRTRRQRRQGQVSPIPGTDDALNAEDIERLVFHNLIECINLDATCGADETHLICLEFMLLLVRGRRGPTDEAREASDRDLWCFLTIWFAWYTSRINLKLRSPLFKSYLSAERRGWAAPGAHLPTAMQHYFGRTYLRGIDEYEAHKLGCEARGEVLQSFFAAVNICGLRFVVGDVAYAERVCLAMYDASEVVRSDAMLAVAMGTSMILSGLVTMDLGKVIKWAKVVEEVAVNDGVKDIFLGSSQLSGWIKILAGDVSGALDDLDKASRELLLPVAMYFSLSIKFNFEATISLLLLMDESHSPFPAVASYQWSSVSTERVAEMAARLRRAAAGWGTSLHMRVVGDVLDAIIAILRGLGAEASKRLRRILTGRRKEEVAHLGMLAGFMHGIIGKFAIKQSEREVHKGKAVAAFEQMGTPLFLTWMQG